MNNSLFYLKNEHTNILYYKTNIFYYKKIQVQKSDVQ